MGVKEVCLDELRVIRAFCKTHCIFICIYIIYIDVSFQTCLLLKRIGDIVILTNLDKSLLEG